VKSLRLGRGNLLDAWAGEKNGELWLYNAHIPTYPPAKTFNHEPKRTRKLLVHRRELDRLTAAVQRKGETLVPLRIYFNGRGIAKVELGVARGKRKVDKRESEKQRDWDLQRRRLLREKG